MIEIDRIIREMKQGQTVPYLCHGNDGNQYIVKGSSTTYRGLICEWVCGQLAKIIGLPVPDFEIVYIDRNLVEYEDYNLEEGDWFASKYEENIQDILFYQITSLDSKLLKLLFVFDYWIKNGDRTLTECGGNPNLFIRSDLCSFVVLDHNLAFDDNHQTEFEQFKKNHVSSTVWFTEQRDLFDDSTEGYTELLCKGSDSNSLC